MEGLDDCFCMGANRGSPGLEIILCVGKILSMVLRHMRGYHDRILLTVGLSRMDSHPVPVEEYFHGIAGHTDADRFSNQVIWNRHNCLIRQLRYNQEELSDPTRETVHRNWQGAAARILFHYGYKHRGGSLPAF